MINGTNMLGKDNPRWPIGNAPETVMVPDAGSPVPRGPALGASVRDTLRTVAGNAVARLIGLPRRAGRRLFAMNDLESRWRGWQVIELAGGLGRQYRDTRFDSVGPERRILAVPEAWDDHGDGRSLGPGEEDAPGCQLGGGSR